MAVAALERLRTVLLRSGQANRLGPPLDESELAKQAAFFGGSLPPSYAAVMRVASQMGERDRFLRADEMTAEAERISRHGGEAAKRYSPFCKDADHIYCFDRGEGAISSADGGLEPVIVEWGEGTATPIAAHFGEWLASIADEREDALASAEEIPPRLKRLLFELGFRFEYPVLGRLETADVPAVTSLIGDKLATAVRGDVDRLFDSSGKASISLNVEEFTVAVSLRTGIYVFQAEDVFRWLRTFRDENYFSDAVSTTPGHADDVRDLRRATREPILIRRAVLTLAAMPASSLLFRSACGTRPDDFYLLARTASTSERGPSTILHVESGVVGTSHKVEAGLNDIHVTSEGTIWGLTTTHAVRIAGGRASSFPLPRLTRGRPWWYGIGGVGERVFVWGTGALLEFDGRAFVPFTPDAMLDGGESVVALQTNGQQIQMLVCGEHLGAVARFDGHAWIPINEHQVIGATLTDLDVRRGTAYVVDRDGGVWKMDGGPPHPVALLTYHQAYLTETGIPRPIHGVRAWAGGLLLASMGGVIAVGGSEPLFHAVPDGRGPVRLVRLGDPPTPTPAGEIGEDVIVALSGPSAWLWQEDGFSPIDVREW